MQVNFREIWYNYRSEVVFFIVLSAIVALSTYLSQFIPEAVFDNTITPILITATVATALIGVLLMRRHHNGIKARKLFGWALLVWGLSDLIYLIGWAAASNWAWCSCIALALAAFLRGIITLTHSHTIKQAMSNNDM